eukprot:356500-Chlamydomonas_euryale.AAC.7
MHNARLPACVNLRLSERAVVQALCSACRAMCSGAAAEHGCTALRKAAEAVFPALSWGSSGACAGAQPSAVSANTFLWNSSPPPTRPTTHHGCI